MNVFRKRRIKRRVREILRHAKHLRNTREDLWSEAKLKRLDKAESDLKTAMQADSMKTVEKTANALYSCIGDLTPVHSHAGVRENVEVFVVAIVVAMGFRTYFIQPFKIPTGSMQPTLYGITSRYQSRPFFMDKWPMKGLKWFVTAEWYRNVSIKTSGVLEGIDRPARDPANCHYYIAGIPYRIPLDARRRGEVRQIGKEEYVQAGTVLWSGIVMGGDHVFVNKMRWNFLRPTRGEIMVFNTDNITMNPPVARGTHYIKRMVGLPNDKISINPPHLYIDGEPMMEEPNIARITRAQGYRTIDPRERTTSMIPLKSPAHIFPLGEGEYFAFGDNTASSKDSRYWGAVLEDALTGPAWFIYWPFIKWSPENGRRKLHLGRIK